MAYNNTIMIDKLTPYKEIEIEIGRRFKSLRLRKNLSQQQLAESTGFSLFTIKALESGKGKISSIIAVLRVLDALDQINQFIPDHGVSPLQLAKMKGKERHRASGSRMKSARKDDDKDTDW